MDRDLRIRLLFEALDKVTGPLKEMAGGSSRAAQNLRAARQELDRLKRSQADIASFRRLKQQVGETEAAMQTAQARVASLARQMQATDNPTRKLSTEFSRAQREAKGLKAEWHAQTDRLQQLRTSLNGAGIATSNLAEHERRLRANTARANAELDEQKQRLIAINNRSQRLAAGRDAFARTQGAANSLAVGGTAALGTGLALGAPLMASVGEARQFESVMTDIAQKADLSRGEARQMGVELLSAAQHVNQLPEALQQGVETLAGLGLDPRQAATLMNPIGRAATAYKAEIADLSNATFAGIDNLKVPIGQTAKMLDVMAMSGKRGAFELADMAQYFPSLTASAQALGQKGVPAVADLAAALQITRKGAGDSAQAANNLQNLLNKINTEETIRNFKQFGIDLPKSLRAAADAGKSPIEAITELSNQALNGDMSKLSFLFGDAQVQAALRPLMQNMELYRQIRAEALAAGGTVDADFANRLKDGAEQAKAAEIGMKSLGLTMGALLLPTVNKLMTKATALANRLGRWAQENPKLAKGIAIVAGGLAAALIVFGGLGIVVAGLIAPFAALSFVAGALGIGLLPVIGIAAGVVVALGLLAAAAYLIYDNWDAIVAWFGDLWQRIKVLFGQAVDFLINAFLRFSPLGLLMSVMNPAIAWLRSLDFAQIGKDLIQGLINGITNMLGALKNTIVNAASLASTWFKEKLGIHSPSRVFAGFGGFMMQGLNQGIAGGEAEPIERIKSLASRITAAMALGAASPALAAVASVGSSAGANESATKAANRSSAGITINIYGAPSQDEHAIARAVAAEIERIERDRAARRRSSYSDD